MGKLVLLSLSPNFRYASGLGSWMTPLHHAALKNEVGKPPFFKKKTHIFSFLPFLQMEAAKILVEHGADVDERGFQDALKG